MVNGQVPVLVDARLVHVAVLVATAQFKVVKIGAAAVFPRDLVVRFEEVVDGAAGFLAVLVAFFEQSLGVSDQELDCSIGAALHQRGMWSLVAARIRALAAVSAERAVSFGTTAWA